VEGLAEAEVPVDGRAEALLVVGRAEALFLL
jgi:hypothetical protein